VIIRTISRRQKVLSDGRVRVTSHVFIDVPATELTFESNCEIIARELVDEGGNPALALDPAAVQAACWRLLRTLNEETLS
jgi:hypothetical protein